MDELFPIPNTQSPRLQQWVERNQVRTTPPIGLQGPWWMAWSHGIEAFGETELEALENLAVLLGSSWKDDSKPEPEQQPARNTR